VEATTGAGGRDTAQAELQLVEGLRVGLTPESATVQHGQVVTYTLSVTNLETVARTYTLAAEGLVGHGVALPATLTIGAGQTATAPVVVTASGGKGLFPFAVRASYSLAGGEVAGNAEAVLVVLSAPGVAAALDPTSASGGPGVTLRYRLLVTNSGSISDTYALSVSLAGGWSARLAANGVTVDRVSLTPYVFNTAALDLFVTSPVTATTGHYHFGVTAQSVTNPATTAFVDGVYTVTDRGVTVDIQPAQTTLAPGATGTWQVAVTNTGTTADTFALSASGVVAGFGQFSQPTVSLAPGASTTVQLSASGLTMALPSTYPFGVTAQSQANPTIQNFDTADVTFTGARSFAVALEPDSWLLTDALETSYTLVISNTGNLADTFTVAASASPAGLLVTPEVSQVFIPAHMTVRLAVAVRASGTGTYQITGLVTTATSSGSDTATLIIQTTAPPTPTPTPTRPPTQTPTATPTATFTPSPTATTPPTITPTPVAACNLYPIALHVAALDGVRPGDTIFDIYNGQGPGNFGWLTWTGDNDVPALVTSLTPPGNSGAYINPDDPNDHTVSIGDWIQGKPGVSDSSDVSGT
jgi:hypothetical protein